MPFSKNQSIIFNKEFFKKIFIMKMISKYQNNQEVIQFNTKKKKLTSDELRSNLLALVSRHLINSRCMSLKNVFLNQTKEFSGKNNSFSF